MIATLRSAQLERSSVIVCHLTMLTWSRHVVYGSSNLLLLLRTTVFIWLCCTEGSMSLALPTISICIELRRVADKDAFDQASWAVTRDHVEV